MIAHDSKGNHDSKAETNISVLVHHLRAQLGRRIRDLNLEVRDGGLILRGRADSYHAKQLAQHAVMSMTNLPLAANQIEVTRVTVGTMV